MKKNIKIASPVLLLLFFVGCDDSEPLQLEGGNTSFTSAKAFLQRSAPEAEVFTKEYQVDLPSNLKMACIIDLNLTRLKQCRGNQ